jgi:D-alanyl-D-alanine carboxypeptidase
MIKASFHCKVQRGKFNMIQQHSTPCFRSIFLISLSMLTTVSKAQTNQESYKSNTADLTNSAYQKITRQFTRPNHPGYAILIKQKDDILYRDATGFADIELKLKLKPEHKFNIGSLTKPILASVVLKLIEQEQFALNTNINELLPNFHTHGHQVTLQHLLTHTAGIQDYVNQPHVLETEIQQEITSDELLSKISTLPWQFAPGTSQQYSNSAYALLARGIEKHQKSTYLEILRALLFEPLKMRQTTQGSRTLINNRVASYTFNGNEPLRAQPMSLTWAFGAADIVSTVDDVATWFQNVIGGEFLTKKHKDLFLSEHKIYSGESTQGSFSISITNLHKRKILSVAGSTFGFSSFAIYEPSIDLVIVVLQNSDGINQGGWIMPEYIAFKYWLTHHKIATPNFYANKQETPFIESHMGKYRLENGDIRQLFVDNQRVFYQRNDNARVLLRRFSRNKYYFPATGNWLEIIEPSDKKLIMRMHQFSSQTYEDAIKVVR